MKKHECARPTGCTCYIGGLEPADDCPAHGNGEWPPRCAICGRFMKWPVYEEEDCARVAELADAQD